VEVRRLLADLLLKLGEEWDQQEFVQLNKGSHFTSLTKMLQPYQLELASEDVTGLVHVSTGILDLRGKSPKLLNHDSKYPFKSTPGIRYDKKAKAPKFIGVLLGTALGADDINLIQKYFGSILLGPNTSHGILVIRGTPGGGKSTLVSIIEKMLGESKVAHLRTQHLTGRFETSAFIGKRVLVGKDVPGDTLSEKGARLLKSLVGGDLLQAEIKYNPTKQLIRGNYHVVIASNNRLRIALDGDEEAWRRRLLIVDFENEKPERLIPNFAEKLVAEEGSGILNWLIEGALAYRKEMDKRGALALTEKQQQRVATLLHDSDSVLSFMERCVVKNEDADVSGEELLLGYHDQCRKNRWTPVSGHAFQTRLPDLLCQRFMVCRRNDLIRGGKAVRGYKGLALS
jgi:P4 family phage/plasmid primase-like protien